MSKLLDRRHRWGPVVPGPRPATRQRTCSACGRVDVFEIIIPDALADRIIDGWRTRNPYRTLRTMRQLGVIR